MNEQNLINLATRTQREKQKIAKKGAKKSNEIQKKKKEEKQQQKSLAEILKNIVFSEAKTQSSKDLLKLVGASDNNYFAALSASVMLKGIEKGDINALSKIMELLGETGNNRDVEEDKSFNNLVEAIKNVRKSK